MRYKRKTQNHVETLHVTSLQYFTNIETAVVFWSYTNEDREEAFQNLALATGSWLVFFAASQIDGAAVAVEHWEGEVIRS